MELITLIGVSIVFLYVLGQIFTFLGIEQQYYVPYFIFYIFILCSIVVLPKDYSNP